jgi:tyrosine-protein kinase Etk/Wzc
LRSDVLKIKVLANGASAAKIIANTYVECLIDLNLRNKREEISGVRDFVEKQLIVFQNKLNAAEDTLRNFMEQNKITTIDAASAEILRRLTEAEASYNTAKTDRVALEQRQLYLERKKRALAPTLPSTARPLAQEVDLETLKAREQALQKIIGEYEAKLQMLPNQELQLARVIRARDVNNKIYSMLLEKREERKLRIAGKVGDVHVIDTAENPFSGKTQEKQILRWVLFWGWSSV